ncbi:hypothetical protein WMZ97_12210 [Lentibacillus sp. N15]
MIIPESSNEQYGNVSIYTNGKKETYSSSIAGKTLKAGDEMEFLYTREGGHLES